MIGNWKMHGSHLEAIQRVQKLSYLLDPADYDRVEVGVAPPFTSLRSVQTVVQMDDLRIRIAAQNLHWQDRGAYTGEISASMLAKLSVSYAIVGHSERRQCFGEDNRVVNRKAKAAMRAGVTPIVAVGETLEQRERGEATAVIRGQVSGSLARIPTEAIQDLVIAYEPVWAIGTGRHAAPADAQEAIAGIREQIRGRHGSAADRVRILYGGSMNPGNVAALMAKLDIDGGLIGGASLDPDAFAACVRYWK
ncbi:MAG: triose-phosphate isomerase [bacterium]|nr:triose-phosphate isomerase [bacterium]MDE0290507.1 triose-phosphate isomerase [bacterium]MDE0436905.1 triose-phosphate isomerase [bacterium]